MVTLKLPPPHSLFDDNADDRNICRCNMNILSSIKFTKGNTAVRFKSPAVEQPFTQRRDANGAGVCKEGRLKEALAILPLFDQKAIILDSHVFASLLEVCANVKALTEGRQIHARMLIAGIKEDVFLGVKLINMYANCGDLVDARLVFKRLPRRTLLLWNAMIGGYARQGHCEEALVLYYSMQIAGIQPDNFTFPCVLKVCAGLGSLEQGKEMRFLISKADC